MHQIRILKGAERELARLDKSVGRLIVKRINWLAENLDAIQPEALAGDLSGLYKFRVGNYRIVYEIVHEEDAMVIHAVGHRSEVYRRR